MTSGKNTFEGVDAVIKEVLGEVPIGVPRIFMEDNFEELKSLERRLQNREAELKAREALLQKASLVSETDRKGIITYVNDKFCEVSGYSADELLGQPHNIVRHPDVSKEVFRDMWRTIGRGKTWRGIIKNLGKDGTPYWVDATIAPVLGSDGKPMKYIGIRFDITAYVRKIAYYMQLYKECKARK